MRIRTLEGVAGSIIGAGVAQSLQDQIQNEEPPGSEIQMNTGRGWVQIGCERSSSHRYLQIQGLSRCTGRSGHALCGRRG